MARARLSQELGWNGIAVAVASIGTFLFFLAMIRGGFFDLLKAVPPVPILATLCGVAGVTFLATRKAWAALTAAILTFLFGVLSVTSPGYPAQLLKPLTGGAQYLDAVISLCLGIVALVSGIIAFRHLRGKREGRRAEGWAAVAAAIICIAVGFDGAAAVAQSSPLPAGTVLGFAPDAHVTISAEKDQFSASAGSVKAGGLVQITIDNKDAALHSFTTSAPPATDADILPSTVTTVLAKAPNAAGAWEFVCKYHAGMKGSITVTA